MDKLKRLFGGIDMTWKRVLLFAVASAVLTAGLNLIPALNDTSFEDISINLDAWFLFAVFVIVNCQTRLDAVLKCFVYFLVSQPLIYLLEVPFDPMGWELFQYYGHWFRLTLLTIPGAAIAYEVKRKSWLSVAVLSVATAFLSYCAADYIPTVIYRFPRHLLSTVFCLVLSVFFVLVLLDEKKHRIAALSLIAVVFAASLIATEALVKHTETIPLEGEGWRVELRDERVVDVSISGESATVSPVRDGSTTFVLERDGETMEYYVSVYGGVPWVDRME